MKDCEKKDYIREEQECREHETFEEEVRAWEKREECACHEDKHEHGRRVRSGCIIRKYRFVANDIDICDSRLVLEMCECNEIELCDGQPFRFHVCPCIPRDGCRPRQIFVRVGRKVFPIVDRIGDFVYENQIVSQKPYFGYYGAEPEHIIAVNVLRVPRY